MKWISVKEKPLPKDKVFLALWKGAFVLSEYDDEIQKFCIGFLPAQMCGFACLDKESENRITHWCELEFPEDY